MSAPSSNLSSRLYRLHFKRRPVSATSAMIWANAASWVFRQKPHPRHGENGFTGFEVETRQHPIAAKQALEKATGKPWEMFLLWSRPVESNEGEGPITGENPWEDGWPVKRLDDDAIQRLNRNDRADELLTTYLTTIYRALGRDINILASDRENHQATIRMFLDNPALTAEQAHNGWVERHVSGGWVLGRKFDPARKSHPQIKPLCDLPPLERAAEEAGMAALRAAFQKGTKT